MRLLTVVFLLQAAMVEAAPSPSRPNVLFFLVDDLGWRDLGCCGSTFYETPRIDALARSGMRFTCAYAAGSVCSPTRASIMTGKYPPRVGITDWIPGRRVRNPKLLTPKIRNQLALEEITPAEALKQGGYHTFFAGKWHLGGKGYLPENQGFDINVGGGRWGSPPGGYYVPYRNPKLPDGPPGEYLTDRITKEAATFIRNHVERFPNRPFFAYVSFYAVHTPIQACKRQLPHFQAKLTALPKKSGPAFVRERRGWTKLRQDNPAYASMVRAVDENVGRLLDLLDELGISSKTIVFFFSDNGGLSTLGRRWAPTSNAPLRAGKGWLYEGGIREPLIVRAPGITKPGSLCNVPVISNDFYPTILQLVGLPIPAGGPVDGLSLVGLLKAGEKLKRDALFWHYPHYHGSMWAPGAAVRAGAWKLIRFYEEGKVELYNLADDPGERHDMASKAPAVRDRLIKLLEDWQQKVGAELPRPNPAYQRQAWGQPGTRTHSRPPAGSAPPPKR